MDLPADQIQASFEHFVRWRGPLFLFNGTLAVIPVVLAYLTFRPGRRLTPIFWLGAALTLLFLPNAPYVLTDAIHLRRDFGRGASDLVVFGLWVPGWIFFFVGGCTCYVLAIRRIEAMMRPLVTPALWWTGWLGLHFAVAIGVYLGRFTRLHSWYLFTRPDQTADAIDRLSTPFAVGFVLFMTAVLVVGTLIWRPVVDAAIHHLRSARNAMNKPGSPRSLQSEVRI